MGNRNEMALGGVAYYSSGQINRFYNLFGFSINYRYCGGPGIGNIDRAGITGVLIIRSIRIARTKERESCYYKQYRYGDWKSIFPSIPSEIISF
jgi:hypothetical protein